MSSLQGMRSRLLLAFVGTAILPVLLLSLPLFYQVQRLLRASAGRVLSVSSQATATRLEGGIETTLARALALASDGGIQRGARVPFFSPKPARALQAFLDRNRLASDAYLLDAGGKLVATAPTSETSATLEPAKAEAVADRCLGFRAIKNGFSPYYTIPDDRVLVAGETSLLLSIPVFNSTSDVWSGALCLVLPWKRIAGTVLPQLDPQPALREIRLDGKDLLQGAEPGSRREAAGAVAPVASQGFGIDPGRLEVEVAQPRPLWVADLFNTLAGVILGAISLVALVSWLAFLMLSRLLEAAPRPAHLEESPGTAELEEARAG